MSLGKQQLKYKQKITGPGELAEKLRHLKISVDVEGVVVFTAEEVAEKINLDF